MFAAIDLGSNSFRLHVGMLSDSGIKVIKSLRDPVRLAAGLDEQGNLTDQAQRTALTSLERFREALSAYQLDAVRVVATNTLRVANNAAQFLPQAERAIGYPIDIISGEEEGRLIYMGVACVLNDASRKRLVVDIGGGSTELIVGKGQEIEVVESYGIGTAQQTLSFFPGGRITADGYRTAILFARSRFEDAAPGYRALKWVDVFGSSGTIRAIAEVLEKNDLSDADGGFTRASLEKLMAAFIQHGHVDRLDIPGMRPDRAAVMVGGLAILIGLMHEFGIDKMHPVDAGLRMGVMWDLQLRATQQDRREHTVAEFTQRFRIDAKRGHRVAEAAIAIFSLLKPSMPDYSRYLYWSGQLHEIGMIVSHSGYHKHGAYMLDNADMPGFTTREQHLMSMLVLGQKGNLRKLAAALADADLTRAILALRLAILLMHARLDGEVADMRVKMKSKIEFTLRRSWTESHPTFAYWIQKEQDWWREVGIEFLVKSD